MPETNPTPTDEVIAGDDKTEPVILINWNSPDFTLSDKQRELLDVPGVYVLWTPTENAFREGEAETVRYKKADIYIGEAGGKGNRKSLLKRIEQMDKEDGVPIYMNRWKHTIQFPLRDHLKPNEITHLERRLVDSFKYCVEDWDSGSTDERLDYPCAYNIQPKIRRDQPIETSMTEANDAYDNIMQFLGRFSKSKTTELVPWTIDEYPDSAVDSRKYQFIWKPEFLENHHTQIINTQ